MAKKDSTVKNQEQATKKSSATAKVTSEKKNAVKVAADDVATALQQATDALKSDSQEAYSTAMKDLDNAVKAYNKAVQKGIYNKCAKSETPFIDFVKTFSYDGMKVVEVKDEKSNATVEIKTESVTRRLSLRGFINTANIGTTAIGKIDELRTLLIVKEKGDLNPDDYKREANTWFFAKVERKIENGETPTSNRQIELKIEEILKACDIDSHIAKPDRRFVMQCAFTHDAKHACRVKPVSSSKLQTVMVDVMKHWIDGVSYDVLQNTEEPQE